MRNLILVPLATLAVLPASANAVLNESAKTLARDLVVVSSQAIRSGDVSTTLAQVNRGAMVVVQPSPPPPINEPVADDQTVIEPAPSAAPIDYGVLQFPATVSAAPGAATPVIYGRVYEAGLTEAAGGSSEIIAQLGFGKAGTDPRSDASWKWTSAPFNEQVENNDEYQASFTAPNTPGRYAYTFRFALVQDGITSGYTYADVDGAGTNPGLSFESTQLGALTVTQTAPSAARTNPKAGVATSTATPEQSQPGREPLPRSAAIATEPPAATVEPTIGAMNRTAHPQSLEQQVVELQNAVSALQTQVERLEALKLREGDQYLTQRSPGDGNLCSTGALMSLNDTIQRTRADADDAAIGGGTRVNYYRPPAFVWVYYDCRNAEGRRFGDAQVLDER